MSGGRSASQAAATGALGLPDRCVDLNAAQVLRALESMTAMGALLRHMARIARPREGAPKILVPIARMASSACDWVDGGLYVELTAVDDKTEIMVGIELGGGVRELLFPRLSLGVSQGEFVRAVRLAPQLVAPMRVLFKKDSLVLTCEVAVVGTIAPLAFAIADESLRRSLSASLRRSLPPLHDAAVSMRVEMPAVDTTPLARMIPKAPRMPVVDESSGLHVGWGFGASSSTANTCETVAPPDSTVLSTAPTRRPAARSTKAPAAPRSTKAPAAPARPPPSGKRPAIRPSPKGRAGGPPTKP